MHRLLIFILMFSLLLTPFTLAQDDSRPEIDDAVTWIILNQLADGGWGDGFSEGTSPGYTADAIFALVAAGYDIDAIETEDGLDPLDYLTDYVSTTDSLTPGVTAKMITALVAVGFDPSDFNGVDLVAVLLNAQDTDGLYLDDMAGIFGHCLAMIALDNALGDGDNEALVDSLLRAAATLATRQNDDGGWGFAAGLQSDTNTTALCIQGLAELDTPTALEALEQALAYLAAIQNEDGGWPYQNPSDWGTDSDTSSTSLVYQALVAVNADPDEWRAEAIVEFLLGLQNENGAYGLSETFPFDNFISTITIVPALVGVPYSAAYQLAMLDVVEGE